MQSDVLFKGLTRPAMLFGVPMTPLVAVVLVVFLIAVWTNKIILLILIPIYITMNIMTRKDDFIFNLSFLKLKLSTPGKSKEYYGAKTYSASNYRKQIETSNAPRLSILGLEKNPTLEDYIPYTSLVEKNIVTTKDYALLATWKVEGVSFDIEDPNDVESGKTSLNMIFKAFSNANVSFYVHSARHTISDKLSYEYDNKFLTELSDKYYEGFTSNNLHSNSLYLTLCFNPLKSKMKASSFKKGSYEAKQKEFTDYVKRMHELTGRLEANLKNYNPKRLGTYIENDIKYSRQLEFYNFLISGKQTKVKSQNAPVNQFLTGDLQNIQFNNSIMQFNYTDDTKLFARAIEIKDYSPETYIGILDHLLYLNINYTMTQSYTPLPKREAKEALIKAKKQLISSEDEGISQIDELEDAIDDLISDRIGFGNYHFSMLVYGKTVKEVKENTEIVLTELQNSGHGVTLADIALPATYFAQFPTNYSLRPRVSMISSRNYSGFIALHSFPKGSRNNNCWGDAATILKTPSGQPYYLNLHETHNDNDFGEFYLGNSLVIGKSGGGKTAFLSFLMNMMLKYNNKSTFPSSIDEDKKKMTAVFLDKDKGAIANILASGGRYIAPINGEPTGFNPFMCDATSANIRHLQNLIKILITRNDEVISSYDETKLSNAINFIMTQFEKEERKYPITLLLENLTEDQSSTHSIKSSLRLWQKGEKFGWVFDNETDNLNIDDDEISVFGIDGTEFLDDDDVRSAMSYYILWRVMALMDGRRLGIWIDEAWKWISDPRISEEVKNKLKTNRKQNSFFVMAVQSVEDFLKNKNARAIIEQSATMFYFSNPQATYDDYVNGLNCTKEEYEMIKNIDPSTYQFMVKKASEKLMVSLDLSSIGSEMINILSTNKAYVDRVEDIFNDTTKSLDEQTEELKNIYRTK